jgi:hypothetical protein
MRHGVDWPHWLDYIEVEKATGFPGDLAIVELTRDAAQRPSVFDPLLLMASFEDLRNAVPQELPMETHEVYPRGMALWSRRSFEIIGAINIDLPDGGLPSIRQRWKVDLGPDPDFPTLPFIPVEVRMKWSENEKFKRHCQEMEAANAVWMARQAAGQSAADAALDLPIPFMNRRNNG